MKHISILVFSFFLAQLSFGQKDSAAHGTIHLKKPGAPVTDTTVPKNSFVATGQGKRAHKLFVSVMMRSDENISLAQLQVASGIEVTDHDFSDPNNYVVVSFDLVFGHSGAFVTKHAVGSYFTDEMKTLINQAADGDVLLVQNVKYKINGQGKELAVKGMTLTIKK